MTLPFKAIVGLWSASLLFYIWDPYVVYRPHPNLGVLVTFIMLNVFILIVVDRTNNKKLPAFLVSNNSAKTLFKLALLVSVVFLPINIRVYTGSSLSDFTLLLTDPVEAYGRMHLAVSADRSERVGFLMAKLSVSWLTVMLLPLAILLHMKRQISSLTLIFAVSISFVLSVFRGTDKELADIMIFLIAGRLLQTNSVSIMQKFKFKLLSKESAIFAAGSVVFVYFFLFRKSERLANLTYHCFQNTDVCMDYAANSASPFRYLSMLLYRYATHGYYGLSTSFDANQVSCPLIGDSRVLQYIAGTFGIFCETTITTQLDYLGWTSKGAWSTGFTQLANNLGHFGVFLYIAFFAFSLKLFLNSFRNNQCYLSGVMYMLNFFILFYMIGNLQLQQIGEQYFGYLILNAVVVFLTLRKGTSKS